MAITTVLFDLDGTLLPLDQDVFVETYFGLLAARMADFGYNPKELIATVWKGIAAMVKNDGSRTNEQVFWKVFTDHYGEASRADEPKLEAFYKEEFDGARQVCGYQPLAAQLLKRVKEKGLRAVLATNPLFPAVATRKRIRWAGLQPEDFALYTTYENSVNCKPNPDYYRDILTKLGAKAEECVMVGNDVGEDMIAEKLGMQVFLLTDCIINRNGQDISRYPHGDFNALMQYIERL